MKILGIFGLIGILVLVGLPVFAQVTGPDFTADEIASNASGALGTAVNGVFDMFWSFVSSWLGIIIIAGTGVFLMWYFIRKGRGAVTGR